LKIRDSLLEMMLGDDAGVVEDDEDEIHEDDAGEEEVVTRKGRSASTEMFEETSDLSDVEEPLPVPTKAAKAAAAKGVMADDILDELVSKTRRNFLRVSVADRIELLRYIVENVLLDMDRIGSYIDKSIDEVAKMKLEIREVVRERRSM
jgi:hypothetical protein